MEIFKNNNIVYKILTAERLDETITFVTEHFVAYEYLTRESGLTVDDFKVFVKLYCEASLLNNLSIIAVDEVTDELVGFSINEDPNSDIAVNGQQFYQVSSKYTPFLKMLESLSARYLNIAKQPKSSFHLYLLGVKPSYQGQKIGTRLVQAAEIVAKQESFNYVVVEATSPVTKPLCENLGYTNLGNIVYSEFELDGERPFAHVQDYDGPHLFLKEIQ